MRIFATLAVLAALIGGAAAHAYAAHCETTCENTRSGQQNCYTRCYNW